jgi:hypothetical protein
MRETLDRIQGLNSLAAVQKAQSLNPRIRLGGGTPRLIDYIAMDPLMYRLDPLLGSLAGSFKGGIGGGQAAKAYTKREREKDKETR